MRAVRTALLGAVASSLALSISAPVQAQDAGDVVIMRRVIAKTKQSGEWRLGEWSDVSQACGLARQTRTVTCAKGSDQACSTPKPATEQEVQGGGQNCAQGWAISEYGDWNSSCSPTASRYRSVVCRTADGGTTDVWNCDISTRPNPTEIKEIYEGCTFAWKAGDWMPWSSQCSPDATRSRPIACINEALGNEVDPTKCDAAAKPPATERGAVDFGCEYRWSVSDWSPWDSSCSNKAVHTRQVSCISTATQAPVDESLCPSDRKPATSETGVSEDGCNYTYQWDTGAFGPWSSQCSPKAERTRQVTCRRNDGAVASDAKCEGDKPPLAETKAIYDACSHVWEAGSYGPWGSTCSDATSRTRQVRCMRTDNDDYAEAVDEASCDAGTMPSTIEEGENYESCTYAWQPGEWVEPAACGETVTFTRPVNCMRVGYEKQGPVADALCDPATRPEASTSGTNMRGCSYTWKDLGWGPWSSTCSAQASRMRSLQCVDAKGVEQDPSKCEGVERPETLETGENYSGCTYGWRTTAPDWSNPEMCAASQTRNVSVTCMRSDNTEATSEGFCTGAKPASTETRTLPGCTYAWEPQSWSPQESLCGTSATQTREVLCKAYDATTKATSVADDSMCAGTKPSTVSPSYTNNNACTYAWVGTPSTSWDSTCSVSASRSVVQQCVRSDPAKTVVGEDLCKDQVKPPATDEGSNLTDCATAYVNTSFDAPTSGVVGPWTVYGSTATVVAGYEGKALQLRGSGGIIQNSAINYKTRDNFRLEFWARGVSGTGNGAYWLQFGAADITGSKTVLSAVPYQLKITTAWQFYSIPFNPVTASINYVGKIRLSISNVSGSEGAVQIDSVIFYPVKN